MGALFDRVGRPPEDRPPATQNAAEPQWPVWYERSVLPFTRRADLFPVLFAVLGHLTVALAALMLFVVREGSVAAAVVLAGLGIVCVRGARVEQRVLGRPGALALALSITWVVAGGLAFLCDRFAVL